MRLRLRVERNALPFTQALWPVKDPKCTIAQLLQSINEIFPLEADTWGLEDYSISIGGYECLHYYEIGQVCRDEDEILIKPLQFVDARSRTLTGRDQIASDGRHLLDGVPFGRPALKAPIRPDIKIPPRKKQKLLHDEGETVNGEEEAQLMLLKNGEDPGNDEDEEEEEDDEDFEVEPSESEVTSSSESEESDDSSDTSSDEVSSDEVTADTPESDYDDAESWNGISNSEPPTPSKGDKSTLTNGVSKDLQSSAETSSGKKRKRSSVEGQAQVDELDLSTPSQADAGSLSDERSASQRRNHRKRDVKKLKHLISVGELETSATLETLHTWQAAQLHADVERDLPDTQFEERRKKLMADLAAGGVDVSSEARKDQPNNKRRKVASHVVFNDASTSFDKDDTDEPPTELTSKAPPTLLYDLSQAQKGTSAPLETATMDTPTVPSAPRPRLDLAGSKRLVFGSLGVRVPKTQAERDQLQQKLAGPPKRGARKPSENAANMIGGAEVIAEVQEARPEDDEDWRSKINLTAVECCDEDIVLSEPPFPFHQRWDPQYKSKKARQRMSSTYMGKRKRGGNAQHIETYDKYHVNGESDVLNYDDVEDEDEYWEEGALLDVASEDEQVDVDQDDGFPTLPASVDHLPALPYTSARNGDFVTYAELACDESTEWQPRTVNRLVQIIGLDDYGQEADVQLSSKDFKPKAYDEEGNRVYSKFEMPDHDDQEDDNGRRILSYNELETVRLVSRPGVGESG